MPPQGVFDGGAGAAALAAELGRPCSQPEMGSGGLLEG